MASWSSGMIPALGFIIHYSMNDSELQEAPRSNRGGALFVNPFFFWFSHIPVVHVMICLFRGRGLIGWRTSIMEYM